MAEGSEAGGNGDENPTAAGRNCSKPNQQEFSEGEPEWLKAAAEWPPGMPPIPKEYRDLAEAFREKECDILPPH